VKFSKEVKVGLLAVIACTILYLGIGFLKGSDVFSPSNTYYAIYDDIEGLTVSNPVLINGLNVGRVNKIRILQDEGYQVLVELHVDKHLKLGQNTIAYLATSDILGSKAIVLDIGAVNIPKVDGDTLIARHRQSMADALAEKAGPLVESLDTVVHNVNEILVNFSGNSSKIYNTAANLEELSLEVRKITAENRKHLNDVLINLKQVTMALNDPNNGIGPIMTKMNVMADSLNKLEINKTLLRTEKTVAELQNILSDMNKGEGTVGKLLKNDSLYMNLNRSAEDLDKLLEDIRKNPKKYVNFSILSF
jgi:phospholipid/cholesterol/gamma-HCH transport system substrate-binding protein